MSTNKAICAAFFDVKSNLQIGNNIVYAIYSRIARKRNSNKVKFDSFDERMWKAGSRISDIAGMINLFDSGLKMFIFLSSNKWDSICYHFHVADVVDRVARNQLNTKDYILYQREVQTRLCATISAMHDVKEVDWNSFALSEELMQVSSNDNKVLDSCITIGMCFLFVRMCQKLIDC